MGDIGLFLSVVAIFLASCTATQTQSSGGQKKSVSFIKGKKTLDDVLAKATAENKIVFIDFYIDNCAPCKVMDDMAFTDKSVYQFYNKNFINFKVDAIDFDYVELAKQYNVREYPTLVYIDNTGKVLLTHYGGASAIDLLDFGRSAINKKPVM